MADLREHRDEVKRSGRERPQVARVAGNGAADDEPIVKHWLFTPHTKVQNYAVYVIK
jgi:hypothetical protein